MAKSEKPFSILLIGPAVPGLSCDLCSTSGEALQKIKKGSYQLILVDSASLNDEQLLEILTEINRLRLETPLVFLAAPGEEIKAHQALKLGAADYLVKNEAGLQDLPERLWSIYRNYELMRREVDLTDEIGLQQEKLWEMDKKFRELSVRDELTGLYNHRYLQEKLVQEFRRAVRYSHPLSCLLLDLDLFRGVNERWGHARGDEVLKAASRLLLESCRLSDLIARLGGEEFALLLPHIDYQGALNFSERLRGLFAEHTFVAGDEKVSLTVSIGISSFPEDAIKYRSDLLRFAGEALFQAKAGGRNQIFLYRDLRPTMGEAFPDLKINEEKVLELQRKLSEVTDKVRRAYIESSKELIRELRSQDPLTAEHAERVAHLANQVAKALGLPLDEAEMIEHAGLLHDIGRICLPEALLLKEGELTLAEYEAVKEHPYLGYRILKPIKFLREEATVILHHHEWFNGEGYPSRLAGNEIPLGSRIISVVDAYDTMRTAGRRYRKTLSVEDAVGELVNSAGIQFDPQVVQAFLQVLLVGKELAPDKYDKELLTKRISGS